MHQQSLQPCFDTGRRARDDCLPWLQRLEILVIIIIIIVIAPRLSRKSRGGELASLLSSACAVQHKLAANSVGTQLPEVAIIRAGRGALGVDIGTISGYDPVRRGAADASPRVHQRAITVVRAESEAPHRRAAARAIALAPDCGTDERFASWKGSAQEG